MPLTRATAPLLVLLAAGCAAAGATAFSPGAAAADHRIAQAAPPQTRESPSATFIRTIALPSIQRYRERLVAAADGKWRPLPEPLVAILEPHYPLIDLRQVMLAENIDTLHGKAITFGDQIFLPRAIDLAQRADMHWLLHELEHSAQYAAAGGETAFLTDYLENALQSGYQWLLSGQPQTAGGFDLHGSLAYEQAARQKADSRIGDVWSRWDGGAVR